MQGQPDFIIYLKALPKQCNGFQYILFSPAFANSRLEKKGCLVCFLSTSAVRPTVRRRVLEQRQVQHSQLPAADDDQLGHRGQRLVPAPHDPTGR